MSEVAEMPVVDPAMDLPPAERIVSEACDAVLDQFVRKSEARIRKFTDAVYEDLLISVQEYLKENANWNLAQEIDRCRRTETENYRLREQNDDLVTALQIISRSRLAGYGLNGKETWDVMAKLVGDFNGEIRRLEQIAKTALDRAALQSSPDGMGGA